MPIDQQAAACWFPCAQFERLPGGRSAWHIPTPCLRTTDHSLSLQHKDVPP